MSPYEPETQNILKRLWKKEPAVVVGFLVGAVVLAAGQFNIVLDENTQTELAAALLPLVTSVLVRFKVSPAA